MLIINLLGRREIYFQENLEEMIRNIKTMQFLIIKLYFMEEYQIMMEDIQTVEIVYKMIQNIKKKEKEKWKKRENNQLSN